MKMRIGIDARSLTQPLTGIGNYTLNMIDELDKHQVETFLFSPSPLIIDPNRWRYAKIISGHGTHKILKHIWALYKLPKQLNSFPIDLFWGPAHRLPTSKLIKIPRAVTIHDMVWKKASDTMKKSNLFLEFLCMPKTLFCADLIITVSHSTHKDVLAHFPQYKKKIHTIPLGGFRYNELQKQTSDPIHNSHILFVGTIEPRKNISRLIEAYSRLSSDTRDKHPLIIVGRKGWGNINLSHEIKKWDVSKHVDVKHEVSNDELKTLYATARFVAFPSLYEGFGLPILEAHSYGIPVLTSNISSMLEVAGKGAEIIDPYNVVSILNGMENLLHDDDHYREITSHTRSNIERYNWSKSGNMMLQSFTDLLMT